MSIGFAHRARRFNRSSLTLIGFGCINSLQFALSPLIQLHNSIAQWYAALCICFVCSHNNLSLSLHLYSFREEFFYRSLCVWMHSMKFKFIVEYRLKLKRPYLYNVYACVVGKVNFHFYDFTFTLLLLVVLLRVMCKWCNRNLQSHQVGCKTKFARSVSVHAERFHAHHVVHLRETMPTRCHQSGESLTVWINCLLYF